MTLWIVLVAQLLVLAAAYVMVGYIKELPRRLHEEGVKKLEFSLNTQLAELGASLSRDIELLKISQTELQAHKNVELLKLSEFFAQAMTNPRLFQGVEKKGKAQQDLKKKMFEMGMKLFFFASDDTVREFNSWRAFAQTHEQNPDPTESIRAYARLMLMIRKDVGHDDTALTEDDYLRATIVDWDAYSAKGQEGAK